MVVKAYRVEGQFMIKNKRHIFTKETLAKSEEEAQDYILSIVGSNHRVKRRMISINNITELAPEDVKNPVVKYKLEG
jgi:large subunit ribosomal protein LX